MSAQQSARARTVANTNPNSVAELKIRNWLNDFQSCVQRVDFEGGKKLFASDVVAFGSVAQMVVGLDALLENQWSLIWPNTRGFKFHSDEAHLGGTATGGWALSMWDSLGLHADGTTFARVGRVSLIFEERNGKWLAIHSHYSLLPASNLVPGR